MNDGRSNIQHALLGLILILGWVAPAFAASPRLNVILPRGGQRGTQLTIDLHGQWLQDARALVLDDPDLHVAELTVVSNTQVRVTLEIAPECRLGPHAVRLHTATGLSNLKTFSVGALPEISEIEPNDSADGAQPIEIDTTVNGVARNEDVDYYAFQAEQGQRVSIEIEAMGLGDVLFDVFLALFDGNGFELASCDDSALLRQDPFVSVVIPQAGRYVVQVRESAYAGNDNCRYRLHVGRFLRPAAVFPLGGRPGEALNLKLLGEGTASPSVERTLPEAEGVLATAGGWITPGCAGVFASDESGIPPTPNFLRVTDLDNAFETEPNNGVKQATVIEVPCAVNGIIEQPGDRDCFRFTALKDQSFDIFVLARRMRTPLDSVLTVHDANGKYIAGNDDSGGPDSALRFSVPADGEYVLIIRDHLNRGGPEFAYRIEIAPARPFVRVETPRQIQAVAVPRGGRAPMMLTATRYEIDGPLAMSAADLPPGVTMQVVDAPAGVDQIPVVFEAAADAQLEHGLSKITLARPDSDGTVVGGYRQDVELTLGQNNIVFMAHSVDRLPVAVVEAAPFSIEVEVPTAPMVRDGSMQLLVKAIRAEGYEEPINLRVPFRPSGVGASDSIVIEKGQSEARIPFNANGNAVLGEWHLLVAAHANVPSGGVMQISSQLFPIRIAEPFVAFQPQATSVEQGQKATVYIEVQKHTDFEGPAEVTLQGLPHHVTAEPVMLAADQTSISFEVATQPDSPPGVHKNVFCIARFMQAGAPVVHRLPAGELRIEKPLPVEVAQAPTPPPDAPPDAPPDVAPVEEVAKPAPEKPLTRLQQLRKRHESRTTSGGGS